MRASVVVALCAVALCLAPAAWAAEPVTGIWQEEAFSSGDVKSVIDASGPGWSLTADKLESAVPGPAGWQWQTTYVNGVLDLAGLGGITDTVTGLELTNLNNNHPQGFPVEFELTGSGTLTFGSQVSLTGYYNAEATGFPSIVHGPDSILVRGALTEAWLTVEPTELIIEIKPGSDMNPINPTSNGVLPVAILGSEEFDVANVLAESLLMVGVAPKQKGKSGRVASYDDVNEDGFIDLMAHFPVAEMDLPPGMTSATMTGVLVNGETFTATDNVYLVGKAGVVSAIPEPGTLGLLALAGVAALRRRRR